MSVLQRKAQAGKREHQARAMSVPKALRLCLSKVADKLLGLPITVIGIVPEDCEGERVSGTLDDTSLFIVLDGPYRESAGISLGHELVSALVQQQTVGQVLTVPTEPRPLTSTDASLCAPLIETLISKMHSLLESEADRQLLPLYRFGARCQDARLFDLALNAGLYQTYRLTLDINAGSFQSGLTLYLPLVEVADKIAFPDAEADEPQQHKPDMHQTAMVLPVELLAILLRDRRPLSTLSKLKVGDTIAVPPQAFDAVDLVTKSGLKLCAGAMGQVDGMRAMQLHSILGTPPLDRRGDFEEADEPDALMPEGLGAIADLSKLEESEAAPIFDNGSNLSDLPELPDVGDLPSLPDPDTALGDLPDLDLSDDIGMDGDGLPDLPDLDNLPDLPDLPELDDLPKLNSA